MYDAIDVRLYLCCRRNNYDCTLNINKKCEPMPNVMAALPNIGGALC